MADGQRLHLHPARHWPRAVADGQQRHVVLLLGVGLVDGQRPDPHEHPAPRLLRQRRPPPRGSGHDVPEVALVVEPRQVGLVEGLLVGVGHVEGLLEVGVQVVLQHVVERAARPVLVDVLQQVGVEEGDLVGLLGGLKGEDAGVAGVVDAHLVVVVELLGGVLRLGDGVEAGDVLGGGHEHQFDLGVDLLHLHLQQLHQPPRLLLVGQLAVPAAERAVAAVQQRPEHHHAVHPHLLLLQTRQLAPKQLDPQAFPRVVAAERPLHEEDAVGLQGLAEEGLSGLHLGCEVVEHFEPVGAVGPGEVHAGDHAHPDSAVPHLHLLLAGLVLDHHHARSLLLAEHPHHHPAPLQLVLHPPVQRQPALLRQLPQHLQHFQPLVAVLVLGEEVLEAAELLGAQLEGAALGRALRVEGGVEAHCPRPQLALAGHLQLGLATQPQLLLVLGLEGREVEFLVVELVGLLQFHDLPPIINAKKVSIIRRGGSCWAGRPPSCRP